MANYLDTATATRAASPGDWVTAIRKGGRRSERIACEIILSPSTLVYRETCAAGLNGVEIGREDLTTMRIELMPGGKEVRLIGAQGRDLGVRLPHPLGLMALAWWTGQAPYGP